MILQIYSLMNSLQTQSRKYKQIITEMSHSQRSQKQNINVDRFPLSERAKNSSKNAIRLSMDEIESIRSSRKSSQKGKQNKTNSVLYSFFSYMVPQITNEQKQTCSICESSFSKQQFIQFGSCQHSFCSSCLKQFIKFKLDNSCLILCPLEGCSNKIDEESLKNTKILSSEERQRYSKILVNFQILANPDMRLCVNQKCKGRMNLREIRLIQMKDKNGTIKCHQCNLEYCKKCLQSKHQGACDSEMIRFLEKNKKYRQCQRCKRVVQKTEGCTHITCLCGYPFCYMCGQQLKQSMHKCVIPSNLGRMARIRWQIQHYQLFYQSNQLSFSRCFSLIDLSPERNMTIRVMYSILYSLTIYPVTILVTLAIITLFSGLLLLFILIIILFLPLTQLNGNDPQYCLSKALHDLCGYFGLFLMTLVFFPIFVLAIIVEGCSKFIQSDQAADQVALFYGQIGKGLRNVIMMPFLICANHQTLDSPSKNVEIVVTK